MRKVLYSAGSVVALAIVLSLVESYILWGYCLIRPRLDSELLGIDELIGVSSFKFTETGRIVIADAEKRSARIQEDLTYCLSRPVLNDCLDGLLILRLQEQGIMPGNPPLVPEAILHAAWSEMKRKGWFPTVEDGQYTTTGRPAYGLAVQFRKGGRLYLILTYNTGAIADDYYAYSETLLRVEWPRTIYERQVYSFLDISGLEVLQLPVLLPLNGVLVAIAWVVIVRLRNKSVRGQNQP
jgi:hypothetical protein